MGERVKGDISFDSALRGSIHRVSVGEVFTSFETDSQGLSQVEAEKRHQKFGRNTIREVRKKPLYLKFLANFTHLMAILLWLGGIVGFLARMPELGLAIWMVNRTSLVI